MRHGKGAQRGFALVIVLWVLAGLTVVAVAVASSVFSQARSVSLLRERVLAERAFLDTGSRIKVIGYRALGVGASLLSLRGELFVDGRETQVSGSDDIVALQDVHGLVSLRGESSRLSALLGRCGVPVARQPALLDALYDYVDADGLKRLNGAEAFEYSMAGESRPRNAPLLSRGELWRVLGWNAHREGWTKAGCDRWVTVRGRGQLNRQTAPLVVLEADGLAPEQAQALRDARELGLSLSNGPRSEVGDALSPLQRSAGGGVASVIRVHQRLPSLEWALEYELEFSRSEPGGPWQVHEMRVVPARTSDSAVKAVLPSPDYLLPESERARLNALSVSPFDR